MINGAGSWAAAALVSLAGLCAGFGLSLGGGAAPPGLGAVFVVFGMLLAASIYFVVTRAAPGIS